MWSRPIRRLLRPVRLMAFTLLVAAWPLRAQSAPVGATLECPATAEPKQQPRVTLVLAGPYAGQLSGRLTLTFVPNAAIPSDDASLQFSTGGRSPTFTLAAGSTRAEFSLQTGTVAGAIRINATLEAAGVDVTPVAAVACTITLARRVPAVTEVGIGYTATGFNLSITGYSTPRQVTEARFRFLPRPEYNWAPIEIVIPAETIAGKFSDWYRSSASAQFGSQFTLLQPFRVDQNLHTVGSVYVSLRNQEGLSAEQSASFP